MTPTLAPRASSRPSSGLPLLLSLLTLAVSVATPARAATLKVPGGYKSIAAALAAAQSGDTIIVADGTYDEHGLDPKGKAVTLESQNGPAHCVLDGQQQDSVFDVETGETASTVLQGFTLQHGLAGADIQNDSSPTIRDCVFTGNDGYNGGAIHVDGSAPTIIGCEFTGNSAFDGGAISVFGTGGPTITGCRFTGNTARNGGAVQVYGGASATITYCAFTGNTVVGSSSPNTSGGDCAGGALLVYPGSAVVVAHCAFTANRATGGDGSDGTDAGSGSYDGHGGGYWGGPSDGGALCLSGSETVADCIFTANTVTGGSGGAAYPGSGAADGHGGEAVGGAVAIESGSPTLTNCVFRENGAYGGDGGTGSDSVPGSQGGGGGVGLTSPSEATPSLTDCTFNANVAQGGAGSVPGFGGGGALMLFSGSVTLTGCILWGDLAAYGPEIDSYGPVTLLVCDVQNYFHELPVGSGNISADPLFLAAPDDLHPLNGSPCIGAGATLPGVTTDLDGRPRRFLPTMGAYEAPTGSLNAFVTAIPAFDAVTGQRFSGPVARFTDPNPAPDFRAVLIDWGDGTAQTDGVISGSGPQYVVSGHHVYAAGGDFPVTIGVRDRLYDAGVFDADAFVAPAGPRLTASASSGQIVLTWTALPRPVSSYRIFRGTTPGGESVVPFLTRTAYADKSARPGTTYYYKVQALNPDGTLSNEASAKR